MTFMVEYNSDNKISIKPVLANEQQAVLIDKALEAELRMIILILSKNF